MKDLLIKDVCARLPYGVVCEISNEEAKIIEVLKPGGLFEFMSGTIDIKPYLRSLDDMTEDEKDDFSDAICNVIDSQQYINAEFYNIEMAKAATTEIDWLIAHHFDFRGLIGLGLAIRVTPENNPYK